MKTIDITMLNKHLDNTICGVVENNEPITIAAQKGNVVIISEEKYNFMQDKLNIKNNK